MWWKVTIALGLALLEGCAPVCPGKNIDPPMPYERLALDLVEFLAPNNQTIYVNPSAVVSLREPTKFFHETTHCVIYKSDGKFVPVLDDCETVSRKLEAAKQ